MSRGRARHHGQRRRAYSLRQHEVRERRARVARDERYWISESVAAVDVSDELDVEGAPAGIRLQRRASAA